MAETKENPKTIYVDDVDGKKFYELTDHDAMTLREQDILVRNGALRMVREVKKKTTRQGTMWTVRLDDGFAFDPRDEVVASISGNMRSIRYWRPRAGF